MDVRAHEVEVDRLRTAYLTAGPAEGEPVVLLHGGGWGECARLTWSRTLPALADAGYRVVAPDWLGFGASAKVRDFEDLAGRMIDHLARLLDLLGVQEAHVVGHSMGGSHLLRAVTAGPALPVRSLALVSAGGAPIDKSAGARLMAYDGTLESMREQVALAMADPAWAADDAYVAARRATANAPGAYEWFAALSVRAPWAASSPPVGDGVPYESIDLPTLVVAGAEDALKPSGYAADVAARIPGARLLVVPGAGHCPHLEAAGEVNAALLDFVASVGAGAAAVGAGA